MATKKKIAKAIVFASVFLGTLVGTGIALLASPKQRDDTKSNVLGTFSDLNRNLNEGFRHVATRFAESGAVLSTRAREKLEDVNYLSKTIRDRIDSVFKKGKQSP
jgi:ABC-type transporter Mla subunit MlaD